MFQEDISFRKSLYWGAVGIHAITPLVFLTRFTQNPYSIQILLLQSTLLALWGWTGVRLWRSRPLGVVRTPLDFPLAIFGCWALFTWGLSFFQHGLFYRSGIFYEGIRGALFLWVNAIGAFFLSTQLAQPPEAPFLRRLMLGIGGISAAYGILQYFGIDPLWGGGINPFAGRPVSTYGNPNFLSSVLVLLLPLVLQNFLTVRQSIGIFGGGGLGLVYAAALIATMTRSSWIGASLALSLYAVWDRKTVRVAWTRALVWSTGLLTLLLCWPASTLGSAGPLPRMADLWKGVTGGTLYAPWHQRLLIWRSAWDMWAERPWSGKGFGLFELFFPYYQGRLLPLEIFQTFRTHANNAHELVLEIGSQTGLIGLGLFIWIVLVIATTHRKSFNRQSRDQRSLAAALLAGVAGMAADNAFGNVSLFFAVPGFLFFFVLGQWAAIDGREHVFRLAPLSRRGVSIILLTLCCLGINFLFRGFLAEAASFRASLPARADSDRSKEEEILLAKKWKRFDVHNNFDLGNLYLRRAEYARAQGFQQEVKINAEKAFDAFTDALQSNPSYSELFEARAETLRLLNREAESEQDLRMALLINPLRKETSLSLDSLRSKPH